MFLLTRLWLISSDFYAKCKLGSYKNLISTNLLIFLKCLNSHYDLTENGRNMIFNILI